jgi:hypothetical protein
MTLASGKAAGVFPGVCLFLYILKRRPHSMANKEQKQKKEQKATPKSNKQKKEAARDKKAAKSSKTSV